MAKTNGPQPELTVEDFQPGERIWWDGNRSRQFATVARIEGDKLIIIDDALLDEELTVSASGSGERVDESYIGQWRKMPDMNRLKPGSIISTTDPIYTGDDKRKVRFYYEVTEVVPGEKVTINQRWTDDPFTLKGDNFSRNLEDVIHQWDVECY